MKNFLENLKKVFAGSKPAAEEKKVEPVQVGQVPPLKEQIGEGTKIGHGIQGKVITEEKKKRKKKYFPKQKGQGTKFHGIPRDKKLTTSSGSEEKRVKTEASSEKINKGDKTKKKPETNDFPYRKRENVKKS